MKKYFILSAVAALALASCTSDEYLGTPDDSKGESAIEFKSAKGVNSRAAQTGAAAAETLGKNFIVEGVKGTAAAEYKAMDVVFDNYLVVWGENTAGKTDDNTDDWAYVGKESSDHVTDINTLTSRTVDEQTLKYWDYSQEEYNFVAFSTGKLNMVNDTPVKNTSVKVTKIDLANSNNAAYTFTAKSADDFKECYYTDIVTVEKANYKEPVNLVFKNLSAKVRVGLYEVIPGYSVKDVYFYQDASTTIATGTTEKEATLYTTGSDNIAGSGTITVSYPTTGSANSSKDDYDKAHVDVTADTDPSAETMTALTFGTLTDNYTTKEHKEQAAGTKIFLGRTLSSATMAGAESDGYFTYVIPNTDPKALTLRVDYTLVARDGSEEEIKVHGATAVVPATYTAWQPNYAYTYIFKISDNTNGVTSTADGTPEGLFPITFDAMVTDIADASTAEQTTVTTVAMPAVTTYQYGHKQGAEYAAGDIYVQVQDKTDLNGSNKSYLYTLPSAKTEAEIISALQTGTTDGSGNVTGRSGLVLTNATSSLSTDITTIKGPDGNNIGVTAGEAAMFTATAGEYAFVYDFTSGDPTPSVLYTAVSFAKDAEKPSDFTTAYYKDHTGTAVVDADWDNSKAQIFYQKVTNNGRSYAVKVIHVE